MTATQDLATAVASSDVTLISVGTPSQADGTCDLKFVAEVSRGIGLALAGKGEFHVVVLRCSVPPGTTVGLVASTIEADSGGTLGVDFGVAFCPWGFHADRRCRLCGFGIIANATSATCSTECANPE